MSALSEHYIIELYGCSEDSLDDFESIKNTMIGAADIAGATIIDQKFHRFSPQGVSGVVVIAESHLSIHTWPEHGYAALDLFTCNPSMDIQAALGLLRKTFQPEELDVRVVQRGITDPAERKKGSRQLEPLETVPA